MRPPPPRSRSPSSPAAHPSNAIDRPSPPAGVFLPKDRPTSHRLFHRASPASESHRGRAQRERGVMTPGARSPTTGHRVEPGGGVRKQYFQGWRRKVGGRGWRRQHPSPANASMIVASRAEGFGTPRPTMAEPYRTRQSTNMRAAEGFGCHFQGWHQQQQQQQQKTATQFHWGGESTGHTTIGHCERNTVCKGVMIRPYDGQTTPRWTTRYWAREDAPATLRLSTK